MTHAPDRHGFIDARLPAYLRLRDRLTQRIAAGEWHADQALPSENQLAQEGGLSVGTVRKALQMLVDEGLLERRQGAGTYLRKPAFDAALFRFFLLSGDDTAIPVSRILSRQRRTASDAIAAILGTRDAFRVERLRINHGEVLLAEEIWLAAARFPGFDTLDEAAFGPLLYPLYLERWGVLVVAAADEVSFRPAPEIIATHLGVAPGAPLAVVERSVTGADGAVIEWRRACGRAERFRYRSRIS